MFLAGRVGHVRASDSSLPVKKSSLSPCCARLRGAALGPSVAALLAVGLLRAAEPAAHATFSGPHAAGLMEAPPRKEASGMAASRQAADILWTHDDSGGAPVLHAVDTSGRKRGAVRVIGVRNIDWEDVAAFEQNGTAWLLIADTGDNSARRAAVQLHFLEEPPAEFLKPDRELPMPPAYSLILRYEDGPRDCEGVAVDVEGNAIFLLTKRDNPPRLYRVPLGVARQDVVVAKFVGTLPHVGGSDMDALLKMLVGERATWPTAMDLAADGTTAVVLTYGGTHLFTRRPDQSWPEALGGTPTGLATHGLIQAEAACFSADGRFLFVAAEGTADFVRYDRQGAAAP